MNPSVCHFRTLFLSLLIVLSLPSRQRQKRDYERQLLHLSDTSQQMGEEMARNCGVLKDDLSRYQKENELLSRQVVEAEYRRRQLEESLMEGEQAKNIIVRVQDEKKQEELAQQRQTLQWAEKLGLLQSELASAKEQNFLLVAQMRDLREEATHLLEVREKQFLDQGAKLVAGGSLSDRFFHWSRAVGY